MPLEEKSIVRFYDLRRKAIGNDINQASVGITPYYQVKYSRNNVLDQTGAFGQRTSVSMESGINVVHGNMKGRGARVDAQVNVANVQASLDGQFSVNTSSQTQMELNAGMRVQASLIDLKMTPAFEMDVQQIAQSLKCKIDLELSIGNVGATFRVGGSGAFDVGLASGNISSANVYAGSMPPILLQISPSCEMRSLEEEPTKDIRANFKFKK